MKFSSTISNIIDRERENEREAKRWMEPNIFSPDPF